MSLKAFNTANYNETKISEILKSIDGYFYNPYTDFNPILTTFTVVVDVNIETYFKVVENIKNSNLNIKHKAIQKDESIILIIAVTMYVDVFNIRDGKNSLKYLLMLHMGFNDDTNVTKDNFTLVYHYANKTNNFYDTIIKILE